MGKKSKKIYSKLNEKPKTTNYKTIAFYGCVVVSLIVIAYFTLFNKPQQNNNIVQNNAQTGTRSILPSSSNVPNQGQQTQTGTGNNENNVPAINQPNVVVNQENANTDTAKSSSDDLKIIKSDITKVAKFYPYQAGNTYMEIVAVRATDGSIRTALNTCQVCYDSGRGYYKQEGDYLVCQNCGNRFYIDQVEKIKGGCNPVPILEESKKDTGDSIVIPKEYLESQKEYFSRWKS